MPDVPQIVLPHGGYKKLIVFRKSEVIYQGTVTFCRRFLPQHGDRTVDQMTQAARSCKQNIAEGSAASGTSKETELKLTNVARATLDELNEDYLDYLTSHGSAEWAAESEQKQYARNYSTEHNDWPDWREFCESRPAETVANLMIVVIQQTKYLLDRMIARQAARAESWDAAIYSRLDAAANGVELAAAAAEIKAAVDRAVAGIRKRKGFGERTQRT